jgi:hypothetical protein
MTGTVEETYKEFVVPLVKLIVSIGASPSIKNNLGLGPRDYAKPNNKVVLDAGLKSWDLWDSGIKGYPFRDPPIQDYHQTLLPMLFNYDVDGLRELMSRYSKKQFYEILHNSEHYFVEIVENFLASPCSDFIDMIDVLTMAGLTANAQDRFGDTMLHKLVLWTNNYFDSYA